MKEHELIHSTSIVTAKSQLIPGLAGAIGLLRRDKRLSLTTPIHHVRFTTLKTIAMKLSTFWGSVGKDSSLYLSLP